MSIVISAILTHVNTEPEQSEEDLASLYRRAFAQYGARGSMHAAEQCGIRDARDRRHDNRRPPDRVWTGAVAGAYLKKYALFRKKALAVT